MISIKYQKTSPLDLEKLRNSCEDPAEAGSYDIENVQSYNPLFHKIISCDSDIDIPTLGLNHLYEIVDLKTVKLKSFPFTHYKKPVFIKFSPLLDTLRYMTGKYDEKPEMDKDFSIKDTKYTDINNCSYIDSLFCFLSSRLLNDHGMLNCIDFYGSYLGVQSQFKINIYDDYEYLANYKIFDKKIEIGEIICSDVKEPEQIISTQKRKHKIRVLSEIHLDCIEQLESNEQIPAEQPAETAEMTEMYKRPEENGANKYDDDENNSSQMDNDDDSSAEENSCDDEDDDDDDTEYEDCDDDEEDDVEEEEDDEDEKMMAIIRDYPVQIICLEKCKGTIDELFFKPNKNGKKLSEQESLAILMQVILTLAIYQKTFSFTHNDLHTNNIMYVETPIENLYYVFQGKKYCVPTFGKIVKIIDFGRSIYRLGKMKMTSDCFEEGGDAYTQYNTEPYFNPQKPRINENPSFDLCRLGCSLYDLYFSENPTINGEQEELPLLEKLILRWCMDDNGKNILRKKNGNDRYEGFKLYKMISRIVHNQTPHAQTDLLDLYELTPEQYDNTEHLPWMNIDLLPQFFENV